jgi:hypothetical protein
MRVFMCEGWGVMLSEAIAANRLTTSNLEIKHRWKSENEMC